MQIATSVQFLNDDQLATSSWVSIVVQDNGEAALLQPVELRVLPTAVIASGQSMTIIGRSLTSALTGMNSFHVIIRRGRRKKSPRGNALLHSLRHVRLHRYSPSIPRRSARSMVYSPWMVRDFQGMSDRWSQLTLRLQSEDAEAILHRT